MKIFHKCYIGLVSAWKILCVKICTRGKARATWINSIRGALKIEIIGDGSITIGHRLMSRGPLYLKSVDGGKLHIGESVFFNHANNLVIIDHDHEMGKDGVTGTLVSKPIVIEDRVWCGANVTITKGVHIGTGAVIAAGAVVTCDVQEKTVVAGVPARKIH